jgi:hypothetical protein
VDKAEAPQNPYATITSHRPRPQPLHQNKIPSTAQMSQQGDSQETSYTKLEYPANTPRRPNKQANGSLSPVTPRQSGDLSLHSSLSARETTQVIFYPLARLVSPQITRTELHAKFLKLCHLFNNPENKLTAANNLAIQKVHESLLQKIVELTQEIHSPTARITTLEPKYAILKNRPHLARQPTATLTNRRSISLGRISHHRSLTQPGHPIEAKPSSSSILHTSCTG